MPAPSVLSLTLRIFGDDWITSMPTVTAIIKDYRDAVKQLGKKLQDQNDCNGFDVVTRSREV